MGIKIRLLSEQRRAARRVAVNRVTTPETSAGQNASCNYVGIDARTRAKSLWVVGTVVACVGAFAWSPRAHAGWIGGEGVTSPADATSANAVFAGESGVASYYGRGWQGRRTASGTRFDMEALTAAHHWLPFGTRVRVRLVETGEEVVVVITDRLASARRVIDLSMGAARALGMMRQGVAQVSLLPE